MENRSRSRGFASMSTDKQREIARKGGRAAHEKGRAHEFTSDEAREAGRKGGEKVSVNRMHMAEIGRRGGRSSASRRRTGGESAAASSAQPGTGSPVESRRPAEDRELSDIDIDRGELIDEDGQDSAMNVAPEESRNDEGPVVGL